MSDDMNDSSDSDSSADIEYLRTLRPSPASTDLTSQASSEEQTPYNFENSQFPEWLVDDVSDRENREPAPGPSFDESRSYYYITIDKVPFPGEIIPIHVTNPERRENVRKAESDSRRLIICCDYGMDGSPTFGRIGYYSVIDYCKGTVSEVKCVVEIKKRVRILSTVDENGETSGELIRNKCFAKIEEEDVMPDPCLHNVSRWTSTSRNRQRNYALEYANINKELCEYHRTFGLSGIVSHLKRWFSEEKVKRKVSEGITSFVYWAASSFPTTSDLKRDIINTNSPELRLRHLYEVLKEMTAGVCAGCETVIFDISDQFMYNNPKGSIHVNPHGHLHDIITLSKIKNFVRNSYAVNENFSWFPGYGWDIVCCEVCGNHIGWYFESSTFTPNSFFAATRDSYRIKQREEHNDEPT